MKNCTYRTSRLVLDKDGLRSEITVEVELSPILPLGQQLSKSLVGGRKELATLPVEADAVVLGVDEVRGTGPVSGFSGY